MKLNSLFVTPVESGSGSLIVCIGLMHYLKTRYTKVAFFRPIIEDSEVLDLNTSMMLKYFELDMIESDTYGFTVSQVEDMISRNKTGKLYEKLLDKLKNLEKDYDVVLIEGINRNLLSQSIDIDINLNIAKNFSSAVVAVINAKHKSIKHIMEDVKIQEDAIKHEGCYHLSTFVNRVDEYLADEYKLYPKNTNCELYFLPEKKVLDMPTLQRIQEVLGCEHIFGDKKLLLNTVACRKIAAMRVEHFIDHIKGKDLIITPGDRSDILMALLALSHSKSYPNIAGVILSGGFKISESIQNLLNGFDELTIPIFATDDDTYETSMKLNKVKSIITHKSTTKIATIVGMFSKYVDMDTFSKALQNKSSKVITPIMFEYNLFQRAREDKKVIVLPESLDERILKAAEIVISAKIVTVILIGNPDEIHHKATILGLDLHKVIIIDPKHSELITEFAQEFYDLRKHKGITLENAREIMQNDETYFATMMVHLGIADGMVSGAVNTTANTVRPAFQIIKTKESSEVVSSLFFMSFDTKILVYADCAINQDPNAQELANIAIDTADTAKSFGIEPKIAMLSYSTGNSGMGADVQKIKEATKLVKELRPDLEVEGPIQYDAAIDVRIAKTKLPNSSVAGKATIFIFPDLNTGNNTYKAVREASGAVAIGPVLQGLNKPINDLSRGCEVKDIVNTIAITAIQAQE